LIFFRSADVGSAMRLLSDMVATHGLFVPYYPYDDAHWAAELSTLFHTRALPFPTLDLVTGNQGRFLILMLLIIWLLPNTQQFLRSYETSLGAVRGETWIEAKM